MPKIIDVRTIMPPERHRTIFDAYEALAPGENFLLVADHDPVPLHGQFESRHAGRYSWDYVKQGPDTWQVTIGRVGPQA